MNFIRLNVLLIVLMAHAVHADEGTMKSLFQFQQQMADSGSVEALMKLGRMYEEGHGTARDLNKAVEMYEKAAARGHQQGAIEAKRIRLDQQRRIRASKEASKRRIREEQARRQAEIDRQRAAEQAQKEAIARQQAEEKARRDAIARQRALENARREALARKRAQDKAQRERIAQQRAERARREALARQRAADAQQQVQTGTSINTAESIQPNEDSSFKADPCKSKAARLMTICKGKK